MMSDNVNASLRNALAELHEERARIDQAIAELESCLESLSDGSTASKRRTKTFSLKNRFADEKPFRSRAGWTPEARRAAAERMRNYWASRRGSTDDFVDGAESSDAPEDSAAFRKRSTKGWTPEARRAAAERMREYWAARRGPESDSASSNAG